MYYTYKCPICMKEEHAFKCVMIESGEHLCSNCYYEAQEKLDKVFFTIEEVKNTQVDEDTFKKGRMLLINLLRRYINKHKRKPFETMEEVAKKEISLAKEKYGRDYKDLNKLQIHHLTQYLKSNYLPLLFDDDSTQTDIIRRWKSEEYFKVSHYEDKIKVLIKQL